MRVEHEYDRGRALAYLAAWDALHAHLLGRNEGHRECVVYWTGSLGEPRFLDAVEHPLHTATPFGYEGRLPVGYLVLPPPSL